MSYLKDKIDITAAIEHLLMESWEASDDQGEANTFEEWLNENGLLK